MSATNSFLKAFHGENKIHFRVIKKGSSHNLYGTHEELHEKLTEYNNEGYDVYFVVNSGGTHNYEINKINAVFIDFDCGKDEYKQYYSLEVANKFKEECIEKIHNFIFKPSYIIETRNGIHVYWITEDRATNEQYLKCQLQLISYFNSDRAVKTLERVMRVPGYYWTKEMDDRYMAKVLETNNIKYNIIDLIDMLPDIVEETDIKSKSRVKSEVESVEGFWGGNKISKNNTSSFFHPFLKNYTGVNMEAIKNGDIEILQVILKPEPIEFENQSQFYEYITENIDLSRFLGVEGRKFNCIYHNDDSPSAGIFITDRDQHFYKCHSSKCGFMGNIIRCVERLRRCNRPQAINFIKEVYKLNIKESDWQKEQKNILEENKRMLRSGEFEQVYPDIYKVVKRYINILQTMHDIAMDNVYDEKYSDDNNNVIFYASISKICELANNGKSNGKMADRIGLLAFLLLIRKLREEEIPENYLKRVKHIAAKHKLKNIMNFYSIPSYCDEHMMKTLERTLMYIENNITMKGWTRELLLRTFGEDIANEIYPMFKHRKLTKKSQIRTEQIHKVSSNIIDDKGYATEKEIVNIMVDTYEQTNQKYSREQLEKQVKKSLQEMLDTYGWERVRLNGKLKEELSIEVSGYPFIIKRK